MIYQPLECLEREMVQHLWAEVAGTGRPFTEQSFDILPCIRVIIGYFVSVLHVVDFKVVVLRSFKIYIFNYIWCVHDVYRLFDVHPYRISSCQFVGVYRTSLTVLLTIVGHTSGRQTPRSIILVLQRGYFLPDKCWWPCTLSWLTWLSGGSVIYCIQPVRAEWSPWNVTWGALSPVCLLCYSLSFVQTTILISNMCYCSYAVFLTF